MTLPFVVDPLEWPFAALAAGAMLWAYTRRSDHFIKQLWRYMVISKVEAYRPLLGRNYKPDLKGAATVCRVIFWLLLPLLSGFAAISLAVHVGIVQNPPPPAVPPFDASKFEIVTEGQTIYARPRAPATTNSK